MWKIHRRTPQLIVASALMLSTIGAASAQENNSFSLPGVSLPSGSDEVRAADGTQCRSAVGNGGAYLDVGVLGNPTGYATTNEDGKTYNSSGSASAYARLVIPLGKRRARVDCTRLYDLEVRRLELELKLMEMGLGRPIEGSAAPTDASSSSSDDEFSDDGWSQDGLSDS